MSNAGDKPGSRSLLPASDTGTPIQFVMPPLRLSEKAKHEMAAIERRQARFYQTAHLYWFD